MVIVTVWSLGTVIPEMSRRLPASTSGPPTTNRMIACALGDLVSGQHQRSRLYFTSAAVIRRPLWNVTPGCRWNVYVRPSLLTSQLSARHGATREFASTVVRPSYTLPNSSLVHRLFSAAGSSELGSIIMG